MTGKIKSHNYSRALLACLILLSAVLTPTFNSSLTKTSSDNNSPLIYLTKTSQKKFESISISSLYKKEITKEKKVQNQYVYLSNNNNIILLLRNIVIRTGP